MVFVELDERESPHRIFESLNAKGKPLTQADLIRNYVAMKLPSTEQERVFRTQWSAVEELLHETRKVGRLPELTAFLRHHLAMQTGTLCDEQHVYARFRDRAEREFPTAASFERELVTISRFARYYERLLRPERDSDAEVSVALQRLNHLESSSAYPSLLRVFEEQAVTRITRAQLLNVLAVLESYMVRRYIAGEPANYLNRMFPTLWGQLSRAACRTWWLH